MSHYDTLGVPKDADDETIKRAYRRQSRKHHPDRHGGNHQAMVALNRAFETLSDPDKRRRYDQSGEDGPAFPPLEARARQVLMQLFAQCVEHLPDTVDVVQVMRESLNEALRGGERLRHKTEGAIARMQRKLKRIKFRGEGRNFLADCLEQRISAMESTLSKIDEAKREQDRALELLADFEFEVEGIVVNGDIALGGLIGTIQL